MSDRSLLDLAIIGSGPAALTAALYAARANLKVTLFERTIIGGTLSEIPQINNYPGFSGPGAELSRQMLAQLSDLAVSIQYGECTDIQWRQDLFELIIDGEIIKSRTVLAASGSEPRKLSFQPDKPVSYCALCDGDLVRNKHIAVVGGANSAAQEAIYLAALASSVTIITHSALKADHTLRQQLATLQNLEIREHLEAAPELLNQFDHIFVYIGYDPASNYLRSLADHLLDGDRLLDSSGYIITGHPLSKSDNQELEYGSSATSKNDSDLRSRVEPVRVKTKAQKSRDDSDSHSRTASNAEFCLAHETIIPGLFAAGDVRANSVHQVITAAADGASAALEIISRLQQSTC